MAQYKFNDLIGTDFGFKLPGLIGNQVSVDPIQVRSEPTELNYVVHDSFVGCEVEWRDFEGAAAATPFQSIDWLKCWWDAYRATEQQPSLKLKIIFAYSNGKLVAILPLVLEQNRFLSRLTWLCADLSDYNAPLIERDFFETLDRAKIDALLSGVLDTIPNIDLLYLPKQPKEIAGRPNPFHGYRAHDYRLSYHSAGIGGDWESYFKGQRAGKTRSRLKSKARHMRERAGMIIRECSDPVERSEITCKTIKWKQAQLVQSGGMDPFAGSEVIPFFMALAQDVHVRDDFRVFTAEVDGQPIACAFGLVTDGRFILYQTAYEPGEYARYSPGVLLLMQMMEMFAGEGFEVFDFSIGDEPYKFDWADEHSDLSVTLRAQNLTGWLAKLAVVSKLNLKGWIKSSDRRFAMAKALNRRLRHLAGD